MTMTNIHQMSDREYNKVMDILDIFSCECEMGRYDDEYIYINEGERLFRIKRNLVSPETNPKDAIKYITRLSEKYHKTK